MTISGVLHWLLSQAFFLVRFDAFDRLGVRKQGASKSACGASFTSLFVFYVIAMSLVIVVRWVGRRSMTPSIPFAHSCSLFISAACHPPVEEEDAALGKVKWGVIEHALPDRYGYCSLTSRAVDDPDIGAVYH